MTDSDAEPANTRPTRRRRPRGLAACHRCKSRKQRCDNDVPACSNCLASGEKCAYGAKRAYPADYVRSLELQVTGLQEAIASAKQPNATSLTPSSSVAQHQTLSTEDIHAASAEQHISTNVSAASDLEASAGIVAPSPDSFLGTSSGYPLTKLLRSAMNQFGDAVQISRPRPPGEAGVDRHGSVSLAGKHGQHVLTHTPTGSHMPNKQVGDKLIGAYYERVHPKHPFLPRRRVQALHEARDDLVPAHKAGHPGQNVCDYATLQLVYAIGARYLQLTNDGDGLSPKVSLYS
jgi:hypothetical protein